MRTVLEFASNLALLRIVFRGAKADLYAIRSPETPRRRHRRRRTSPLVNLTASGIGRVVSVQARSTIAAFVRSSELLIRNAIAQEVVIGSRAQGDPTHIPVSATDSDRIGNCLVELGTLAAVPTNASKQLSGRHVACSSSGAL